MQTISAREVRPAPWNKGMVTGQKPPLKRNEIWAIRVRLQFRRRIRDLALFNLGIDSKLQACDLVRLRVRDVTHCDQVASHVGQSSATCWDGSIDNGLGEGNTSFNRPRPPPHQMCERLLSLSTHPTAPARGSPVPGCPALRAG